MILKGLSFAWFPIPTIILFYQHYGLSIEQSIFLKTVLSLSIFLLEIPSGYIADRWGRKFCLVSGGAIWVASWSIYCTQETFNWFIFAETLTGIAGSLISGADTALTYDTLLELDRAQDYRKIEGKLIAIAGISEAICGLIGAATAQYNIVYPFYLQTICLLFYCLIATRLIEPGCSENDRVGERQQQHLWSIIREFFFQNPSIRWLIFLSATFSVATFLIVWLSQAYLSNYGVPMFMFGIIWVFLHLVMSLASITANNVEQKLGLRKALLFSVILLGISFIFLGIIDQVLGIIFVAAIYFVRGLVNPLLSDAINQLVPSRTRATVFSMRSFVFRLGFAIIGSFSGWLADKQSLNLSLAVMGTIFLISGVFCWWNWTKLKPIN
ncbi:MAG: MFS transporter [Cyanobacteria bacterium P01_G01_bin.49]